MNSGSNRHPIFGDKLESTREKSIIDSWDENEIRSESEEEGSDDELDEEAVDEEQDDVHDRPCRGGRLLYEEFEQAMEVAIKTFGSSHCGRQAVGNQQCLPKDSFLPAMPTIPSKLKLGGGKRGRSIFSHFRDYWQESNQEEVPPMKENDSIVATTPEDVATASWEEPIEQGTFGNFLRKAKEDFENTYDVGAATMDEEKVASTPGSGITGNITSAAIGSGNSSITKKLESVSEMPVVLGTAKDIGEGCLLRTRSSPQQTTGLSGLGTKHFHSRSLDGTDLGKIKSAINRLAIYNSYSRDEKEVGGSLKSSTTALSKDLSNIREEGFACKEQLHMVSRVRGHFKKMYPSRFVQEEGRKSPHQAIFPGIMNTSPNCNQERGSMIMCKKSVARVSEFVELGCGDNEECIIFGESSHEEATIHVPQQISLRERDCVLANISAIQDSVEFTSSSELSLAADSEMRAIIPGDIANNDIDGVLLGVNQCHEQSRRQALKNPTSSTSTGSTTNSWDLAITKPMLHEQGKILEPKLPIQNERVREVSRSKKDGRPVSLLEKSRANKKKGVSMRVQRKRDISSEFNEESNTKLLRHKGWKKKLQKQTSKLFGPKKSFNKMRHSTCKQDREDSILKEGSNQQKGVKHTVTDETAEDGPSFEIPDSKSSLSFSLPESMQKLSMLNVISATHRGELDVIAAEQRQHEAIHTFHRMPLEEC